MSRRPSAISVRSYPWSGIDSERRNTILVVGGIAVIVVAALALAGWGYYKDKIKPNHETVMLVGSRSFDVAELQRRTHYEVVKNNEDPSKLQDDIEGALSKIQDEELVRQTAARRGVNLSSQEMLNGYITYFGLVPNSKREGVASRVRSELSTTGLKLADLQDIVKSQALDQKMNASLESLLPSRGEQANLGLIEVPAQGLAIQLHQEIDSGQDFSTLAAKNSTHPSKDKAGDLGWVPRGALPKEVEDAAFTSTTILSDPIKTDAGYFILAIRGREVRDLDESQKQLIVQEARTESLAQTKDAVGTDVPLTNGAERRIALNLGLGQSPTGSTGAPSSAPSTFPPGSAPSAPVGPDTAPSGGDSTSPPQTAPGGQ